MASRDGSSCCWLLPPRFTSLQVHFFVLPLSSFTSSSFTIGSFSSFSMGCWSSREPFRLRRSSWDWRTWAWWWSTSLPSLFLPTWPSFPSTLSLFLPPSFLPFTFSPSAAFKSLPSLSDSSVLLSPTWGNCWTYAMMVLRKWRRNGNENQLHLDY